MATTKRATTKPAAITATKVETKPAASVKVDAKKDAVTATAKDTVAKTTPTKEVKAEAKKTTTVKKTTAAKNTTTTKAPAKKAPVKKTVEKKENIFEIQYEGNNVRQADIVARVNEALKAQGAKPAALQNVDIYVVPTENAVHYVSDAGTKKELTGCIAMY